jgi:transposase
VLRKPRPKDPRQDKQAVRQWIEERLPKLRQEAATQGKIIFYADESSFLLNPLFHRTYAPKGKAPMVHTYDKSFKCLSVCSAISEQGDFVYTMSEDPYTGEKIVEFLKELLDQLPRSIILIWDGASIHHCKVVKNFLATLPEGRLKLVRQPSYSPELNADEQVWNFIKNVDLKNRVFKKLDDLEKTLVDVLADFSKRSGLIKQFFKNPHVQFY